MWDLDEERKKERININTFGSICYFYRHLWKCVYVSFLLHFDWFVANRKVWWFCLNGFSILFFFFFLLSLFLFPPVVQSILFSSTTMLLSLRENNLHFILVKPAFVLSLPLLQLLLLYHFWEPLYHDEWHPKANISFFLSLSLLPAKKNERGKSSSKKKENKEKRQHIL